MNIELGRYAKAPVHLRTCNICNLLKIEDDFHFICVCNKHDDIRKVLFDDIVKVSVSFDTISLEEKFLLLLESQQTCIDSLVINYVNKCFETMSSSRIVLLFIRCRFLFDSKHYTLIT